jgi:TolB-like protein/phage shock protein PspC (stress-responsive transcriptional regulator)/thioredoxin-like negative regulator of GroEL
VGHWLAEFRRRNVHRVLLAYVAGTWLIAQVAEFLAQAFGWPPWILRALVVLFLLGLPAAAVIAWFFELTREGLVREKDAPAGSKTPVPPPREPDAGRVVLAVLPFKPIVASNRDEALEFGMTDTLITRLSGVSDVIVRPLSSVRRYAALEQDPLAAGRELGVGSVLDGSVQKGGERLRVTARLLRVEDGQQLWSGRFDEEYVDVFAVQDSIAGRVSAALALKLSSADRQRITRRATNDTVAYDLFLNGRYYWNRRAAPDDLRNAIDFYSRAVARDPEFALAYSGLADALAVQAVFGVRAPDEAYSKALEAAEHALRIDPDLAEARATRGHIRLNGQHDWAGSLDDYDEAIRLDPRYAMAHMWRGFRLLFVGRAEEGLAELQAARDLEPDSLVLALNHARGLYWVRRYDDAATQLARVLEIDPGNGLARAILASVDTQRGRCDAALALLAHGAAIAPGSRALQGVALAVAGRRQEADAELRRLTDLAKQEYVSAYDLASISAALGYADAAFEWLDRAVVERSSLLPTLRVDPVMDGLRADPRFVDIERTIRMPPR